LTDFDLDYPPSGVNRTLIPAAPAPLTPPQATPPPCSPLEDLQKQWIVLADVSRKSVDIYASATKLFLLWLADNKIQKPCREDILAYKTHLEETKKPTTVSLYIAAIRQFFKWLDAENVYKNVAQHVKSPKIDQAHRRDYLNAEQIKAVLNNNKRQTEADLRDYAIMLLMVTCGLRRIEVCRADVEDIRTVGSGTRLYIQGKGKADKADFVKIPPPTESAIREYLTRRGTAIRSSAIPLFTSISRNSAGQRLSTRFVSEIVKRRLQMAGYDNDRLCAHSLRHSAVTLALLAGQPLQEVQQFARHTSINTTLVYAHNIDKENNNCAQAIARVR